MTARIRGPLGAARLVALTFAISPPGTAAADTTQPSDAAGTPAFGISQRRKQSD